MIKIIPFKEGVALNSIIIKNGKIIPDPHMVLPLGLKQPDAMFTFLHEKKLGWKLDCSAATPEEQTTVKKWMQADLGARILRAILNGLPVHIEKHTFQATSANQVEVAKTFAEIKSYIKKSKKVFGFTKDDETGLTIKEFTRTTISFPVISQN